jgi:hypothetical protein
MKNLKLLGISVSLLCVLSMTAFAGATNSPPCTPPDPGETNSPPCTAVQIAPEDPTPQTISLTSSNLIDEYVVSEVAIGLVRSWLSIY